MAHVFVYLAVVADWSSLGRVFRCALRRGAMCRDRGFLDQNHVSLVGANRHVDPA